VAQKQASDSKKAVAYIRVSTDDQAQSLETQRSTLEYWAMLKGVSIIGWHTDAGVCGATAIDECPGLLAAIDNLVHKRAGILVVAKRDRLARDVMKSALVERLVERQGARVVSAAGEGEGDTPSDKLMRTMIDVFAEYERAIIRGRVKNALADKQKRGERTGGVPYGMMLDETGPRTKRNTAMRLIPNPEEQKVVQVARKLRASGLSFAQIAEELGRQGFKPRIGPKWFPIQALRMCA